MITPIENHRAELDGICRRYRVRRLDLFGSAAKGRFREESCDLDFVVVFEGAGEPGYATRYYEFAEALEALFGRKVDVLTERMIGHPDFRQELERTRRTVYEQRGQKTPARCPRVEPNTWHTERQKGIGTGHDDEKRT